METLTFKWTENNELLDPFYLTKIWNQFAEFKQFDHQNILLRKKQILKCRALHEGPSYQAVLECKSRREVRSMTYYRYQLKIIDEKGKAIEISSDFVVVAHAVEKFNQTSTCKEKSYPHSSELQKENLNNDKIFKLTVDWKNVLKYLAKVEDDNPVHPQVGIIPGDYIAMQIIQHWTKVNKYNDTKEKSIIHDYQSIKLKFLHPMYREDQLFCKTQIEDNGLSVEVNNQYGENCMILTFE
ncbi:hypothetical protein [Staphylococcus carnosus]|uniref:Uncharacterized protein n=2 Tax=Staphylococcus carnosus TaxID=1281 RepID=B9DKE4_STACT|nr:hypothetical protein [Staphylococcus carnosus]ANZ32465.1 hypothetical protein BEK99_00720 [Staphylococcus carnosus]KKB25809.1 hypothetical protein VV61_04360 [Staphylococcus carnosus]KOR13094.1 hypothetical protein AMC75_07540 [Staphylococcus carnosus]POA03235.1 hypothetical protein CD153_05040 [Staphylococcus carnosus]QPT05055.1 hypothetical protein I6G40_06435 [Staphylococcus carnosus]